MEADRSFVIRALTVTFGPRSAGAISRLSRALAYSALAAALLGIAGCRSDPGRDILESELREQENVINHLNWHLEDFQAEICALKKENAALKGHAPGDPSVPPPPPDTPKNIPKVDSGFDTPGRSSRRQKPIENELPAPREPGPPPLFEPSDEKSANSLELLNPIGAGPLPKPLSYESAEPSGGPASQIAIDVGQTGGWVNGGQGGQDGLRVVFQLRDSAGKPARAPGLISVALLDPSMEGDAARVARWNLTWDESRRALGKAGRDGIKLELPWPGKPPAGRQLQLFVRYSVPDGPDLVADETLGMQVDEGGNKTAARAAPPVRVPGLLSDTSNYDGSGEVPPTAASSAKPRVERAPQAARRPTWSADR